MEREEPGRQRCTHDTEVDGLDRWPIRRALMSDGPTLVVRGHVGSDARKLNLAIPA
jgi:hypothetical protein